MSCGPVRLLQRLRRWLYNHLNDTNKETNQGRFIKDASIQTHDDMARIPEAPAGPGVFHEECTERALTLLVVLLQNTLLNPLQRN